MTKNEADCLRLLKVAKAMKRTEAAVRQRRPEW
jgi:hypothetical protein